MSQKLNSLGIGHFLLKRKSSTEDFQGWTTSPLKEEQRIDGNVYSVQQGEYLAPVLNNSFSRQEVNAKTISERVSGMEWEVHPHWGLAWLDYNSSQFYIS